MHPGERFFEALRERACARFGRDALRGGVFVDPYVSRPYLFHLALIEVVREVDSSFEAFRSEEPVEYRLVGLRQEQDGRIEACPGEHPRLLLGVRETRG